MDTHSQSDELGLATEGEMLDEKDIRDIAHGETDINYPMPGETVEETHMGHSMPSDDGYKMMDEKGEEIAGQ